jgi:phosphoribosylanthranilate isomerase
MRVKVCGVTRLEDALLAADLGAHAIGFVLWPGSPRAIDPLLARDIIRQLPPLVSVVGVFVDQPLREVRRLARLLPLDAVQLHGCESPSYCETTGRRVIKAFATSPATGDAVGAFPRSVLVLLDARDPVKHGGTGRTVDWELAARIAHARPTLLAGGLRADNVAEAIERVRPFGIDVSSGVEARPGLKDAARLREFFAAVRDAVGARHAAVPQGGKTLQAIPQVVRVPQERIDR